MGHPDAVWHQGDIVSKSSTLTVVLCEPAEDGMGKYTAFDTAMPSGVALAGLLGPAPERALLFLDQIKREKGVWWMPRQ